MCAKDTGKALAETVVLGKILKFSEKIFGEDQFASLIAFWMVGDGVMVAVSGNEAEHALPGLVHCVIGHNVSVVGIKVEQNMLAGGVPDLEQRILTFLPINAADLHGMPPLFDDNGNIIA